MYHPPTTTWWDRAPMRVRLPLVVGLLTVTLGGFIAATHPRPLHIQYLTPTATIGGQPDAYLTAYGRPAGDAYVVHIGGELARVQVVSALDTGGQPHVQRIVLTSMSDTVDAPAVVAFVQAQLPRDARPVMNQPVNGRMDAVYMSPSLAATFPAATFAPSDPGTISWQCGDRYEQCVVAVGLVG